MPNLKGDIHMNSNPIRVAKLKQSLWLDNIQRRQLKNGELAAMIERGDIRGMTSNPSIFHAAITKSDDYTATLSELANSGQSAEDIYEHLAVEDIQAAADLFRPLYDETEGEDGYVSLEVSPYLAYDTEKTIAEAKRLWDWVNRPNLMVKIPATPPGLPAITETLANGINVNVTLIFSQSRYMEVMDAHLSGLEKRLQAGHPINGIASVASFFVSRIDSKVDKKLEEIMRQEGPNAAVAASLRGRLAIANAKLAYEKFKEVCRSDRATALKAHGAQMQRPLWASTSTKNPAYPDTIYLDELIGPNTVNTVPPATLEAFIDHGTVRQTLESNLPRASQAFEELRTVGILFQQVTQELEEEGVKAFEDSFTALLKAIEEKRQTVLA